MKICEGIRGGIDLKTIYYLFVDIIDRDDHAVINNRQLAKRARYS